MYLLPKSLKKFDSVEQLQATVNEYIHYYNHDRIKLKLKGLIPVQESVLKYRLILLSKFMGTIQTWWLF